MQRVQFNNTMYVHELNTCLQALGVVSVKWE